MILAYVNTIKIHQLYLLSHLLINSGQGVGLAIEAWKITKAVDIRIVRKAGIIPYTIEVHDKHVLTEDEKKTQEYVYYYQKWKGCIYN